MKAYRIYFMKCSYTSECYVYAESEFEAVEKFHILKGENAKVLSVETL